MDFKQFFKKLHVCQNFSKYEKLTFSKRYQTKYSFKDDIFQDLEKNNKNLFLFKYKYNVVVKEKYVWEKIMCKLQYHSGSSSTKKTL